MSNLLAEMVELEHDRVGLTAVRARMLLEELDQVCGALQRERLLACPYLIDVSLPVGQVVLAVVRRIDKDDRGCLVGRPPCGAGQSPPRA